MKKLTLKVPHKTSQNSKEKKGKEKRTDYAKNIPLLKFMWESFIKEAKERTTLASHGIFLVKDLRGSQERNSLNLEVSLKSKRSYLKVVMRKNHTPMNYR